MSPRATISEEQVTDSDFLSPWEHDNEAKHYFYKLEDVPTYSGTSYGKHYIRVKEDLSGLEYKFISAFPRYYIEAGVKIDVDDYGQYVIQHGTLEVAGTLELGNGGTIIVQQE